MATRQARIGDLSDELTSFVGRRREANDIRKLLVDSRLVTLTGIGGIGKTRLATRVAADVRRTFPDGVWLVDLSELQTPEPPAAAARTAQVASDSDTIASLVAAALGLREQGGDRPLRRLTAALGARHLMLVLDNCDHFLAACAELTDALLSASPDVRVLATSREPLGTRGEVCYQVPPLPTPGPGGSGPGAVGSNDSVALFVSRARCAVPSFRLTEHNAAAVAELCRRLDGLPLAIELAAVRVRALAPQQILDRLTDRFALLSRGHRTAPRRQRMLKACVDGSFDSCDESERLLWGRLSVFVGGVELDAITDVCTDDLIVADDVPDLVRRLTEKSILVRADVADPTGAGGTPRYRMLETIRDYGKDLLAGAGDDGALHRRHQAWCHRLVTRAAAEWLSGRQAYWNARLTLEHANLRAAVEYCRSEPGWAELSLEIAVGLPSSYVWGRGLFRESRRWLDLGLAGTSGDTPLRARAMLLSGHLAVIQGDAEAGLASVARGEEIARRLGLPVEAALAAYVRGVVHLYGNGPADAIGELERVGALLSTAARLKPRDKELRLSGLILLGVAAAVVGDHDRATACHREVVTFAERLGEGHYQSYARWPLALAAWQAGEPAEAAAHLASNIRLKRADGSVDRFGVAQSVEGLAWIAAAQQRYERAATLLGAAAGLWSGSGLSVEGFQHLAGHHDDCERETREALGPSAFAESFGRGESLSYDDVLAYALDEQPRAAVAERAWTPLTRRERTVAELVARGLSNQEIAAELVLSRRTAESHVEHIRTKLGFSNRAQIASWFVSQQVAEETREKLATRVVTDSR